MAFEAANNSIVFNQITCLLSSDKVTINYII
jgi:hypothetical protein